MRFPKRSGLRAPEFALKGIGSTIPRTGRPVTRFFFFTDWFTRKCGKVRESILLSLNSETHWRVFFFFPRFAIEVFICLFF